MGKELPNRVGKGFNPVTIIIQKKLGPQIVTGKMKMIMSLCLKQ